MANILVEAQGATLDPLPSLYGGPAYTNSATYSNDLTNAVWTASNVTVAKDANGLTGAPNTACTLTATAGNGTVIRNAITAASGTHTTQWHIKRKTGTGTIEITVDNGTTWQDVTSLIDSSTFNECLEGLTVTNPQIGIRIVTSGDAVYVGNTACHLSKSEAACRGSAPIVTAASTVTTTAISMSYDIANNNNTKAGYFMEFAFYGNNVSPIIGNPLGVGGGNSSLYYASQVVGKDSDNTACSVNPSGSEVVGTFYKAGFIYDLDYGYMAANLRATWGSDAAFGPQWLNGAITTLNVLGYSGISTQGVSLIRNIRRFEQGYASAKSTVDGLMT